MEPRWLIGGPSRAEEAMTPQQADDDSSALTGKYKGKTSAQWREMATAARTGAEPFRVREYTLCADLAEKDGMWEFPALFTLTGALVPQATWIKLRGKDKWVWRIGQLKDASWFDPSKARDGAQRRRNDAAKGFAVGVIRARAAVYSIANGSTVGYYIGKVDNSPIEIVDDGRLGTQYRDR